MLKAWIMYGKTFKMSPNVSAKCDSVALLYCRINACNRKTTNLINFYLFGQLRKWMKIAKQMYEKCINTLVIFHHIWLNLSVNTPCGCLIDQFSQYDIHAKFFKWISLFHYSNYFINYFHWFSLENFMLYFVLSFHGNSFVI